MNPLGCQANVLPFVLPVPSPVTDGTAIGGFFDLLPANPLCVPISEAYIRAGRVRCIIVHLVCRDCSTATNAVGTRSGSSGVAVKQVQVVVLPAAESVEAVTENQYLCGVV